MLTVEGYFLDGKTSKKYQATLSTTAQSIVITINDYAEPVLYIPFSMLNVSSRLANTPRELSWGNEQLFVTNQHSKIDSLLKTVTTLKPNNYLHKLESALPLVLVSTLLIVALLSSAIVFGVPSLAKSIAFNLPNVAKNQLGSSLSILDKTLFKPSQLPLNKQLHLQKSFAPYLAQYPNLNMAVSFRSGMQANALALPSGDIVFTDDLVNLSNNTQELIAILFHEMGHIAQKHATRRILQGSIMAIITIVITGDVNNVELITALPTLLIDLAYTREFEREADSFAFTLMQKNHIDLNHFVTIMEKIEHLYQKSTPSGKSTNFLSTHPITQERINQAKQFQ